MKPRDYLILLLFIWISTCLTMTVFAAEAAGPRGRVTAGINLRAAPGLSGKVITGLEPGTVVAVTGEEAGWYQIAYEDETYGYRGWVYGKYVEILTAPMAPVVTPTVQTEAPRPKPLTPQPILVPQPPRSETAAVDNDNLPAELPANTIELIQAATPAPAAEKQSGDSPGAVSVSNPAESTTPVPATPKAARARTEFKQVPGRAPSVYPEPGSGYLLSIVLKISSVFLSCLALLISYRTFLIVTAAGRAT